MVAVFVAAFIILGLVPLFVLFGVSLNDLNETQREIKRNEEEIHRMIYGR